MIDWKARDWGRWAKLALIRALKTMAQTAVSLYTVGSLITDMDWMAIFEISAGAAVFSLITSVAGLPEEKDDKDNNG
ncbi:MAG: holin [Clostridia bacterium]|nr:holin [Clostridia bacterium]